MCVQALRYVERDLIYEIVSKHGASGHAIQQGRHVRSRKWKEIPRIESICYLSHNQFIKLPFRELMSQ